MIKTLWFYCYEFAPIGYKRYMVRLETDLLYSNDLGTNYNWLIYYLGFVMIMGIERFKNDIKGSVEIALFTIYFWFSKTSV